MKRVLFVDDEPAVLDGLRRSLYRAQKKWHMVFLSDAKLATERFEREPFDVIVTDMRMPGLDGAQLLAVACERSPQSARIVLSGYAEPDQTMRLVPLAHQYLAKPCEPARLESTIDRVLRLREMTPDPAVRAMVGRVRQVPVSPTIHQQLRQLLVDDAVGVEQLTRLVARDSGVAAKLMHVAGAAFFRQARSLDTLEQAVVHLGFEVIRSLVLSSEVFCSWEAIALPDGVSAEDLQCHAQTIADCAQLLAGDAPWAHEAMLAGLLHDFGYRVLLQQCPERVTASVELARREGLSIQEAEYAALGTSHAEVGAYLLGLWGMPASVVEAVTYHHNPTAAAAKDFGVVAAVAVAHAITDANEPGPLVQRGFDRAPAVDPSYLATVHAPLDWDQARQRIAQRRA